MDTNIRFAKTLFLQNDEILIDTSSLMKNDGIQMLIENYYGMLLGTGKTITILDQVHQELVRHLTSDDEEKANKARAALNLIREYPDIFTTRQVDFSDSKLWQAHADNEILVHLAKGRKTSCQLLISNDHDLSKDAQMLNKILSCRGKKIAVYHMKKNGCLDKYDFIKTDIVDTQVDLPKDMPTINESLSCNDSCGTAHEKWWMKMARVGVGVAIGVVGCEAVRNKNRLIRLLASCF